MPIFVNQRLPQYKPEAENLKILHITEALGGGTESAIREFVSASSADEHHLLYRGRQSSSSGAEFDEFESSVAVRAGVLGLWNAARSRAAQLQPDVVHLHSSWAGLIGRVSAGVFQQAGVVYSPHCFYFERTDIGTLRRSIASNVERWLLARTDVVVAVSPHEEKLARTLGARNSYYVRNLLRGWVAPARSPRTGRPVIATVGRVSRQKDPDFFIETAIAARKLGVEAQWVWIGGGEDRYTRRLRDNGIHVTGWLPRKEARSLLAASSVYVHTAAWESGPVSIEEAQLAGIPIVLRSIPPIVSLGFPSGLDEPDDMANQVAETLRESSVNETVTVPYARAKELEVQANSLRTAYLVAADSAAKRK